MNLFVDGSVDNKTKIGFASYLLVLDENKNIEDMKKDIKSKKFDDTSSTKLELEGFIWALKEINLEKLYIFTDCQNILSLMDRREKLETNNYITKTGKQLKNHYLYKEFYFLMDMYNCKIIKIKGHKKSSLKDTHDVIFSLVDKNSRKALRYFLNK